MFVRKIVPGIAVRAVIFAHRSPGALRQIRPPEIPGLIAALQFGDSFELPPSPIEPNELKAVGQAKNLPAGIIFRMPKVRLPVALEFDRDFAVANDEQIFRILFFRRLGKVE